MTHQRFSRGQFVMLDEGFSNSSIVRVINQTPLGMFTTVASGSQKWEVMSYRLSELPFEKIHMALAKVSLSDHSQVAKFLQIFRNYMNMQKKLNEPD